MGKPTERIAYRITMVWVVMGLLVGIWEARAEESIPISIECNYVATCPSDVTIKKLDQGADFLIYQFSKNDKLFLTLYLGDHPDLNGFKTKTVFEQNGLRVSEGTRKEGDSNTCSYLFCLVPKLKPDNFGYAHFIFRDDQGDRAKLARQIIACFRRTEINMEAQSK